MFQPTRFYISDHQPTPNLFNFVQPPFYFPYNPLPQIEPYQHLPQVGHYQNLPFAPELPQANSFQKVSSNTLTSCDRKPGDVEQNGISECPPQKAAPTFSQQVCHPLVGDDTEIRPIIRNVVATANLGCTLDLKRISKEAQNSEYNPKRLNGVIMRIKEPKSTALIFQSGNIVCLGTKSVQAAKLATRKFARILQKLNYHVKYSKFEIRNMVASCDVKFQINLIKLELAHSSFANYCPDIFPGLVYKLREPKVTVLIFSGGKIVLTGAKNEEGIMRAFKKTYMLLQQFKSTRQLSPLILA